MLEVIIALLNARLNTLNLFDQLFGLAERVKQTVGSVETTFPAIVIGDDATAIDFDSWDGCSYHRMLSPVQTIDLTGRPVSGCDKYQRKTYKMRLVAVLKKDVFGCDDNYAQDKIAQNIENALKINNDKTTRQALKVHKVGSNVVSTNTDRYVIWGEEFTNIAVAINFNRAMISVDYDIVIEAPVSCFQNWSCSSPVVPNFGVIITDSGNPNSPIIKQPGQTYTCLGGGCVGSDIHNSDDTYQEHLDEGEDFELPDVTHTDSDGGQIIKPAMTPLICTYRDIFTETLAAGADEFSLAILTNAFNPNKIAYRVPQLTGQFTAFRTGDDGYITYTDKLRDYLKQGVRPIYQGEDPTVRDGTVNDWLKLSPKTPNYFGNLFVWTDINGGQNFTSGCYVINHIMNRGWIRAQDSGAPTLAAGGGQTNASKNWDASIDEAYGCTLHGFDDYFLPNDKEIVSIFRNDNTPTNFVAGYSAMNLIGSSKTFWSSSTRQDSTTSAKTSNNMSSGASLSIATKVTSLNYLICRVHFK